MLAKLAAAADEQDMRRGDLTLVVALAVVFAPAWLSLARVWSQLEYYNHGFLVPVVAGWMFAAERRRLGPLRRDGRGLAVIGVAALLLVLGIASASPTWQGLACVAAAAGWVLHAWGPDGLRRLAFPLAFLLFMVPLPPAVLTPLILRLQLWVSSAAVAALQRAGFTVLREGNVVVLPGGEELFVAEACSGITSVVTLLPLGALLAYFTERGWLRRAALMLAVVPIAMLGNWLRVLGTVLAAQRFGVARVTAGPLHDAAGLTTFLFACFALIAFAALLRGRALPRAAQVSTEPG
jgi:exosortase